MRSILILALILMKTTLFADTWSSPQVVDKTSNEPAIAVGSQGNAVSVCVHSDGSNSWINASTQIPGSPWSAPIALSQPYQNGCFIPSVCLDPKGNAVAVWAVANQDNSRQVQAAVFSAQSNSWKATEPLCAPTQSIVCNLQLAVDDVGNALALWTVGDGSSDHSMQSARLNYGELSSSKLSWESVDDLETTNAIFDLDMALDPSGNASLIWIESSGNGSFFLKTSSLAFAAQSWSTPQTLTQNNQYNQYVGCQMAVSANGAALALWREPIAANTYAIRASSCAFGSNIWRQTQFSQELIGLSYVQWIGFDGVGNAYLVSSSDAIQPNLAPFFFSKLPFRSNTWTAPLSIGPVGDYARSGCAGVNQAGDLVTFWEANGIIKASTLSADSATGWTPAVQLALGSFAPGIGPSCGLSSNNSCILLYSDRSDGTVKAISGSQLFQTPPAEKKRLRRKA